MKTDRKKYLATTIIVAIGIFILGAGVGTLMSHFDNGGIAARVRALPTETTTATATTQRASLGTTAARVMFAGDNLIHSVIYEQAAARSADGNYDFKPVYEQLEDVLALSDFACVTQDSVISSAPASGYPLFNTPPALGDRIYDIGFTVINQASKHVFDMGEEGAQQTISFWKSKSGAVLTGLYSDVADMNTVKTNTVNGITFAHIGLTQTLGAQTIPVESAIRVVCPVGTVYSEEAFLATAKEMVQNAKGAADIVCVTVSFDNEDSRTPSESQKKLVYALAEYGADVIIGVGTHVLQTAEYITRADMSRAVAIYSLGNLVSANSLADNMVGGIADITFVKDLDTGITAVTDTGIIPIITQYEAGYKDIHCVPFYAYDEAQASLHGASDFSYSFARQLITDTVPADFLEPNPFEQQPDTTVS